MERAQTKIPNVGKPGKSRSFFQTANEELGFLLLVVVEGLAYVAWTVWKKMHGHKIDRPT